MISLDNAFPEGNQTAQLEEAPEKFPETLEEFEKIDENALSDYSTKAYDGEREFILDHAPESKKSPEHRRRDLYLQELTAEAYRFYGFIVPDSKIYSNEEKTTRAKEVITDGLKFDQGLNDLELEEKKKYIEEFQKGFVLDRVLNNHFSYKLENLRIDPHTKKVIRVDFGDSLNFRGSKGYIGAEPTEESAQVNLARLGVGNFEHWLLSNIDPEDINRQIFEIGANLLGVQEHLESKIEEFDLNEEDTQFLKDAVFVLGRRIRNLIDQYTDQDHRERGKSFDDYVNWKKDYDAQVYAFLAEKYASMLLEEFPPHLDPPGLAEDIRQRLTEAIPTDDFTLNFMADIYDIKVDTVEQKPYSPLVGSFKKNVFRNVIERESANNHFYEKYAQARNMSMLEYKQALQAHTEKIVEESGFFVATSPFVSDLIMNGDEERFKTQFEVNSSGSVNLAVARAMLERTFFAFPTGQAGEENKHRRPVYGYMSNSERGVINKDGDDSQPSNFADLGYGTILFKVKKEVVDKKGTCIGGDSQLNTSYVPTPVTKPHFTIFDPTRMDPLDIKSSSELAVTDEHNYFEIQIHNQLRMEHIESIHVSRIDLAHKYKIQEMKNQNLESIDQLPSNVLTDIDRKVEIDIEKVTSAYNQYKDRHTDSDLELIIR